MISLVLQSLIFVSVLFLTTVAGDLDRICGEYIQPLYPNGYGFQLMGYQAKDIPELERMGFYNINFSNLETQGYAVKDSLENIWLYKLRAVWSGKDIWNSELDEILSVTFFAQVIFGAIGAVMLVIMMNNLSNSFAMRLMRRKPYIRMLEQLGCTRTVCRRIWYGFFGIRSIFALTCAVCINSMLICLLNEYMAKRLYIESSFVPFSGVLSVGILVTCAVLMWLSFRKQWRQMDEGC
ncbi:MAG: hypothetical protein NC398_07070 [Acetatifactor muris]|nr:hypothetical protein [Acetatifactor muris]MCM1525698.1 hypothetical protein [Bacteroides sp.]